MFQRNVKKIPSDGEQKSQALSAHKKGVKKSLKERLMPSNLKLFTDTLLELGLLLAEIFKIVMSCLLSIFVPQYCAADPTSSDPSLQQSHACSPQENVTNLTSFNKFVLAWNFVTLFIVLVHYRFVWERERFLITFLDEDNKVPEDNLAQVWKDFPNLFQQFNFFNSRMLLTALLGVVFMTVNIIVSGVLVFRDYFYNYSTATVFFTNILVIGGYTWDDLFASLQGRNAAVPTAVSCVHFVPFAFNQVDRAAAAVTEASLSGPSGQASATTTDTAAMST